LGVLKGLSGDLIPKDATPFRLDARESEV
jgi:hypothetical protein